MTNLNTKTEWKTMTCRRCQSQVTRSFYRNQSEFLCSNCRSSGKITQEEFIQKSKDLHKDKYSYEKVNYTLCNKKITLTCKVHGDFVTSPQYHFNGGGGCKKCAGIKSTEWSKIKIETYIDILKELHPDIVIKEYEKIGTIYPVTVTCNIHGDFVTTFGRLKLEKHKYLCKKCASFAHSRAYKRKDILLCNLYYVYLPKVNKYKLGISTTSVKDRMKQDYVKLFEIKLPYQLCIDLEHQIHNELKEFRDPTLSLDKQNNTELYNCNVLNKIFIILNGASQKQFCVENYLNEEHPENGQSRTKEANKC